MGNGIPQEYDGPDEISKGQYFWRKGAPIPFMNWSQIIRVKSLNSDPDPDLRICLTASVDKVVLQKSISARIRLLVIFISNNKGQVDGFVRI